VDPIVIVVVVVIVLIVFVFFVFLLFFRVAGSTVANVRAVFIN
jgi:hypothetical protein